MFAKNAKFLFLAVGTMIGATALTANLAQAATVSMDLSFFNPSGKQIGQGSFSYDDQSPIDLIKGEHNDLQIGTFKKWFYVKDFEATVKGMTWGLPSLGIWDAENQLTQSVVYDNYGDPSIINQWLMGDQAFLTNPALMMDEQGFNLFTSDESLEGKWVTKLLETESLDLDSNAVPESPTILGVLTAIIGLTLFKRVAAHPKKP